MSDQFAELGVPVDVVGTLHARGIESAFPIQDMTIPDALAGPRPLRPRAHGLGQDHRVRHAPRRPCQEGQAAPAGRGLVLVPTRELAAQVCGELEWLGRSRKLPRRRGLRRCRLRRAAGGAPDGRRRARRLPRSAQGPARAQGAQARRSRVRRRRRGRPHGRHGLPARGAPPLLDLTSPERQTLLFSATLDGAVDALVREYQHDPVVAPAARGRRVDAHPPVLEGGQERPRRGDRRHRESAGPTIVFCRTKHGAETLAKKLDQRRVRAAAIHGNRTQGQRERRARRRSPTARSQVLVATDVAGTWHPRRRGQACVVHHDPPADFKDYTHRSGRTARARRRAASCVSLVAARPEARGRPLPARARPVAAPRSQPMLDVGVLTGDRRSKRDKQHASHATSRSARGERRQAAGRPSRQEHDKHRQARREAAHESSEAMVRREAAKVPARSRRVGRASAERRGRETGWSPTCPKFAEATSPARGGLPRGIVKWFDTKQGLRLHRASADSRRRQATCSCTSPTSRVAASATSRRASTSSSR